MSSAPNQPISTLTAAELEALLTEIIRRVLRQESRATAAPPSNSAAIADGVHDLVRLLPRDQPVEFAVDDEQGLSDLLRRAVEVEFA